MKILVIDDDEVALLMMEHALENNGYEVKTAKSSMEGLQAMQQSQVDLVISDIMMPGMSGLDMLNVLRRFYFDKIPVLLTSSLEQNRVLAVTEKLGEHEYLPKPFREKDLLDKVKELIGSSKN